MESEVVPGWIVVGCVFFAVGSFVMHRLFMAGRLPQGLKDAMFQKYSGNPLRTAGLGLNYGAATFGFWSLAGILSYAPTGSIVERLALWLFLPGLVCALPLIYWQLTRYPERLKPQWYKDLEARHPAGERNWFDD